MAPWHTLSQAVSAFHGGGVGGGGAGFQQHTTIAKSGNNSLYTDTQKKFAYCTERLKIINLCMRKMWWKFLGGLEFIFVISVRQLLIHPDHS